MRRLSRTPSAASEYYNQKTYQNMNPILIDNLIREYSPAHLTEHLEFWETQVNRFGFVCIKFLVSASGLVSNVCQISFDFRYPIPNVSVFSHQCKQCSPTIFLLSELYAVDRLLQLAQFFFLPYFYQSKNWKAYTQLSVKCSSRCYSIAPSKGACFSENPQVVFAHTFLGKTNVSDSMFSVVLTLERSIFSHF